MIIFLFTCSCPAYAAKTLFALNPRQQGVKDENRCKMKVGLALPLAVITGKSQEARVVEDTVRANVRRYASDAWCNGVA